MHCDPHILTIMRCVNRYTYYTDPKPVPRSAAAPNVVCQRCRPISCPYHRLFSLSSTPHNESLSSGPMFSLLLVSTPDVPDVFLNEYCRVEEPGEHCDGVAHVGRRGDEPRISMPVRRPTCIGGHSVPPMPTLETETCDANER